MVVTAQALDAEMDARIRKHQSDRGDDWEIIEAPIQLAGTIDRLSSLKHILVIDCLTLWLTNLLMLEDDERLELELESFVSSFKAYQGDIILVSNETNMGVMPIGELSRRYCDLAGMLHKRLAKECDNVDFIIAGLAMNLKSPQGAS
jgi:adenosylcobinamide kinase / adenosylcobinamide-phosphate guanylyltransferase